MCIYPGSLNWHQGLDVAIRAFASVAAEMGNAEFHIYGEGPAKPSLIKLARDLGMEKCVMFHDLLPLREVATIMGRADLAIEPKRATSAFGNEALSTKILEFMALGVPVVASKTKTHAYYYDESIVKYYEGDDPAGLAAAMVLMRHNPALGRDLARRASEYAAEHNWQVRKNEYLQLTDSLTVGHTADGASVPAR
jgi:glycosyltransferase involved in cell wall biosynthesis